jgi:hypothetical protein
MKDISFFVSKQEFAIVASRPDDFLRKRAKALMTTHQIDAKKNPYFVTVKSISHDDTIRFRFLLGKKSEVENSLVALRVFFPHIVNSTYFGETEIMLKTLFDEEKKDVV